MPSLEYMASAVEGPINLTLRDVTANGQACVYRCANHKIKTLKCPAKIRAVKATKENVLVGYDLQTADAPHCHGCNANGLKLTGSIAIKSKYKLGA